MVSSAAGNDAWDIFWWLMEDLHGDVNQTGEDGFSALDYACRREKRNVFLYLLDKGAKMTDKREALFGFIIDQIKELQKQPSSKMIDNRIDHHINTLHFLMNKA